MKQRLANKQSCPNIIEVSQDVLWKIAKAPDIIETTGLGQCIGVIIYDPRSKQAIVGHFVDPRYNLRDMLDKAIHLFVKINQLKVYVGGGAPQPEDAPRFTDDKAKRAFVKKQLKDHRFQNSQITVRYHDSKDATILRINTATGEVDYDTITL